MTDITSPWVAPARPLLEVAWATGLAYGLLLNALISFLLMAAAIFFFVIRPLNALEKRRHRGTWHTR